MRSLNDTKKIVKKFKVKPRSEMKSKVLDDALQMQETQNPQNIPDTNTWRIIMNNKITKFATAAVFIAVAILSVNFLDKTATPAYALEQTIEALNAMQSIHSRVYFPGLSDPALLWVEFHGNGMPKRVRLSNPAFDPDGPKEAVWENNFGKIWSKKTNTLYLMRNEQANQIIGDFFQNLDPKLLVQKLEDMQTNGTAQIEIEQPDDISEPIVITATLNQEDPYLGHRVTAFVDQATMLVISLETLKGDGTLAHKNGHFGPKDFNLIEFFDYNQPFAEEVFVLNVPDDVIVIDRATNKVGLSQGDMSVEDTAVEVVKRFLQSIIDEDYETAGLMYGGVPAEKIQESLGKQPEGEILKVISIGTANIHPNPDYKNKAFIVPCTIEFIKNGQIEQEAFRCVVREVDGQRGQWAICGGI